MAARRTRHKDAELRRLRDRGLRRARRVARLQRRATLRRLRVVGLCALSVLVGGTLGVTLARYAESPPAAADRVAVALPAEAPPLDRDGAQRGGGATQWAGELAPEDGSPHETSAPPVSEAMLARLYEEPTDDNADLLTSPRVAPEGLTYALPFGDVPKPADPPAWQRYAVPVAASAARPMIAVVLDDLGLNRAGTRRAIALPGPLTLSFMTYAEGLGRMTAAARAAGHELMLHVPMEPKGRGYDPGPNVLTESVSAAELRARLDWDLGRFRGYVGINNHMGSRFSASPAGMSVVMRELRARGLLFLDSVTTADSVGAAMAARAGVPFAQRDVFLDNAWKDPAAIARQLKRVERLARERGYAVAIGHPHRATLDALAAWIPQVRRRGFQLVPVSAIVRHRFGVAQHAARPAG